MQANVSNDHLSVKDRLRLFDSKLNEKSKSGDRNLLPTRAPIRTPTEIPRTSYASSNHSADKCAQPAQRGHGDDTHRLKVVNMDFRGCDVFAKTSELIPCELKSESTLGEVMENGDSVNAEAKNVLVVDSELSVNIVEAKHEVSDNLLKADDTEDVEASPCVMDDYSMQLTPGLSSSVEKNIDAAAFTSSHENGNIHTTNTDVVLNSNGDGTSQLNACSDTHAVDLFDLLKKFGHHRLMERHRNEIEFVRGMNRTAMTGGGHQNTTITSARKGMDVSNMSTTSHNYVGFANFPNQVFRRAIRKGFDVNMMVVGRSGLGKSTFINTLLSAEINDKDAANRLLTPAAGSTVRIEQKTVRIVENGVAVNLTLVDTPGFGGAIDNSKCWEPIQQFVDARFLDYLCEETKLERTEKVVDRCVHVCLYFVAPTGHGLDALDVEFMKKLHDRVNIIPVLAKADSLTKAELKRFKAQVLRDLETHSIKVYKFPESEDPEDRKQLEPLRQRVPFAVIGSNEIKEVNDKKVRCREYPWGVVEVENMEHNDFLALRDMIIVWNMIDLIDVTRGVHFENFRCRQMGSIPKGKHDKDPFTSMEDELRQRDKEITDKKKHLYKMLEDKVAERERKNKDACAKEQQRRREIQMILEQKRTELEAVRTAVSELRRGNTLTDSKTSIFSNENAGKHSPGAEKTKKKTGTLGLFNRN